MVDFAHENLLKIKDVQKHFRVSRSTVDNWFKGGLERRKIQGTVYTSFEAIERFSPAEIEATDHAAESRETESRKRRAEAAVAQIATLSRPASRRSSDLGKANQKRQVG